MNDDGNTFHGSMSAATGSRCVVVGITGASGAVYARRLVQVLAQSNLQVDVVMSASGIAVFREELGIDVDREWESGSVFSLEPATMAERVTRYSINDFLSPVASGSHLTRGMVICPCSGTTLGGIASGSGGNLIQRAAEVHLKQRRPLVLVPRETPVSLIHLENLRTLALAGATILPASPGWYHGVQSLDDLVDFIVSRILDQLGIENRLMRRWGSP